MQQGTDACKTDPEQAAQMFLDAQALYPEETAPYISYAYALYCSKQFDNCISYVENDLALGKSYDLYTQSKLAEILGAAYFEKDDYAAAASFFRLSTAGGDITVSAMPGTMQSPSGDWGTLRQRMTCCNRCMRQVRPAM